MNSRGEDNNIKEEKLEDILQSIKRIIDNNKTSPSMHQDKENDSNNSILELTNELQEEQKKEAQLVSNEIINQSSELIKEFITKIDHYSSHKANNIDIVITELITPLLKEWLDNNLTTLVEKIVTEELKKLIPRK